MKAIDFFCGAGGLTRGLLDAGIDVVAGFDVDQACKTTYEHNNPRSRFRAMDIRNVRTDDLKAPRLKSLRDSIFVGCAPCQPFSQQRKGGPQPHQRTLLGELGRLIEDALPRMVLIENVPGMARLSGNSTFRRFCQMLEANRYSIDFEVLDAKYFGVPQTRRRLVLIAARSFCSSLPELTHGSSRRPLKTVRDAISHFPRIKAGEKHPDIPNHFAASISKLNLERLRNTPTNGGDRRDWPKRLQLTCHQDGYEGHTDVYGRMAWDSPAPTLTGRCHSISNGRYGHPIQHRAISLREAAALQTFPDRYEFFGSNKHIALQIGNAVPVRFAERLGRHLQQLADSPVARRRDHTC